MYALTYEFDELPLTVIDDAEVAIFAAGTAEISFSLYDGEIEWTLDALSMDAYRSETPLGAAKACKVDLPKSHPFFVLVADAIEKHLDEHIREKIWDEIADMRQAARDYREEQRDRVQD